MRQGRTILLQLTAIFLLTEIIFNYIVLTNGDGDLFGASIKTLVFLLFILLFSKKFNWAKWILSISLILYGLLCLLVGFELAAIFYAIGLYDIFFGFYIHKSKALGAFRNDIVNSQTIETEVSPDKDNFADEDKNLYPSLVRRYKALFIDSMLILITLVTIMVLVQDSEFRTTVMVSAASIILLTYEPFLTSFSKTFGQRLMKIRVGKRENPSQRINLLNAYIRWFTKGLLGWISFVTIHFNRQRRAIHDIASDSVVISDE
jgi:predicted membrane protein